MEDLHQTYEDISRLSAYRDLLLHPGYKAVLNDLTDFCKSLSTELMRSGDDKESLRLLHQLQVVSKICTILEQYPQECAQRLESILGDTTEVLKGIH